MRTVTQGVADLKAALAAVDLVDNATLTVIDLDKASSLNTFPAVVFGLPALSFTNSPYGYAGPSDIELSLAYVVGSTGFAVSSLEQQIAPILNAIWSCAGAAVTEALPATFPAGGVTLPSYTLTCEVSL